MTAGDPRDIDTAGYERITLTESNPELVWAPGNGLARRCLCECRLGPQTCDGWSRWIRMGGIVNGVMECDGCDRRWQVHSIHLDVRLPQSNRVKMVLAPGAETIGDGEPSDASLDDFVTLAGEAAKDKHAVDPDTYQATAALLGLAMGEARKWRRRFYVALVAGWFYIGADMLDRVGLPWMTR